MSEEPQPGSYKRKVVGNFNKANNANNLRFTMNQPLSQSMYLKPGDINRAMAITSRKETKKEEKEENKINSENKIDVQKNIIKSIKLLLPTLDANGLLEIQNEINKLKKQ